METFFNFIIRGLAISAPIAFASLGGVFSERSGVVNIALEGIMLTATFAVVWGSLLYGTFWAGLVFALIAGVLMATIHAVVTVTYKVNQIVSGVAINILAMGVTRFLSQAIFGQETQTPFNPFIPGRFLGTSVMAWLLIPTVVVVWFVLFKTKFGLRLRSVGENPEAADTLGISVSFMRYAGVILSGVMCGLAATTLYPSQWITNMTGGRGYIALAAMIFGRWHPVGAVAASLLFGYTETFRIMFETQMPIPPQFVQMLPYVLAVVVLAGVVGRAAGPAASGIPYRKGGK
ncbi:MAG: ABC transporter permease [Spirochaetota bacterium]